MWRLSGVAENECTLTGFSHQCSWKIAAVMWSRVVSDAALANFGDVPGDEATAAGDPSDAASAVEGWFANKSIAKNMSSSSVTTASGTAPGLIVQGPAAAKLAKSWDGLKMKATVVGGKSWDSIAFVRAIVRRGDKKPVTMRLGAVLVEEHDVWRWVSLSLAPPDTD